MVPDNENHLIHDELDETPNVFRFGVYIDQVLVSTLRIHHVTQAMPWSPSMKAFGDIVEPMLAEGQTFICPSRFAVRSGLVEGLSADPLSHACGLRAWPACISRRPIAFRPSARITPASTSVSTDAEQIGEARSYPDVYNKVVLYRADVNAIRELSFRRFPFFQSTPMERRMMFGRPLRGELAPLTILPTAKYYREAAVAP